MKRRLLTLLTFVLSISFTCCLFTSCTNDDNNSNPSINQNTPSIFLSADNTIVGFVNYGNYLREVVFPEEINGCKITAIDTYLSWIFENSTIVKIEIPNTIECISDSSFYGIRGLEALEYNIKDGLKYLGNKENKYLYLAGPVSNDITNVEIDDGCKFVNITAFHDCDSLNYAEDHNGLKYLGKKSNPYFYLAGASTEITTANINANCEIIGMYAFINCNNLTQINFANNGKLTHITSDAFVGCNSLNSLNIPEGVKYIGRMPCLESVSIPNSVMLFNDSNGGGGAFGDLYNYVSDGLGYLGNTENKYLYLTTVVDENKKDVMIKSSCRFISPTAFGGSIETVKFESDSQLNRIVDYNFMHASSLKEIVIPKSVISIGLQAFGGNRVLEKVTFEEGSKLTNIENSAFLSCSNLKTLEIPNSVTYVGGYFTDGVSSLDYYEKDGLYYLGNKQNNYFYLAGTKSKDLTSATIDNNCKIIGHNAFSGCQALKSINIPNGILQVGRNAFYNCSSLESITLPNSIMYIGEQAFYNCSLINNIELPNSLMNLGIDAFYGCKIKSIKIPGNVAMLVSSSLPDSIEEITVDENNENFKSTDGVLYSKSGKLLIKYPACKNSNSLIIPKTVTDIDEGGVC